MEASARHQYTPQSAIQKDISLIVSNSLSSPYLETIKKLYLKNDYKPLWINTPAFSQLTKLLSNPLYNYKNKDFNKDAIKRLSFDLDSGAVSPSQIDISEAKLDILMSDAFLRLIHFVRVGDVDWNLVKQKLKLLKEQYDINAIWEINPKKMPKVSTILAVIKNSNISSYMQSQLPLEKRYRDLIKLLHKYRRMPNFSPVSEGRILRLGSTDSRISEIKRLLAFFGDYPKNMAKDNFFDRQLASAVSSFRKRFKLPSGDFIDNKMIFYLNMPKKEYIKKIIVNLDKLKLYPHSWEKQYIEVNVPEYKMRFYKNGKSIFSSDVVVGRIDRPTPIFNSKMKYIVLNPTWTIPDNLVRRDLIPMLKKNPDYLKEHNIHVYTSYRPNAPEVDLDFQKLFSYQYDTRPIPYRFVQFPSSQNALGRVKFMFPNKYAVYLHDTDNRKLFGYRYRVFSSGCMRVERPMDLLNLLIQLDTKGYSAQELEDILDTNTPTTIYLKKPIPVHIVYFTVRKEGREAIFLYDIYLYDQIIWESTEGHKKAYFTMPKKRLNPLRKPKKRKRIFPF